MTILVAGNSKAVTAELSDKLKSIRADAKIVVENDSLLAGQYAFNNKVDIVFAQSNMKRMSGAQLIEFVRREHPGVLGYLVGSSSESGEASRTNGGGITSTVTLPISPEKIKALLAK